MLYIEPKRRFNGAPPMRNFAIAYFYMQLNTQETKITDIPLNITQPTCATGPQVGPRWAVTWALSGQPTWGPVDFGHGF